MDSRHRFIRGVVAQALEALHSAAVAVWHLQRVLARKRDPLSHTLFAEEVASAGAPQPLERFWYAAGLPRALPSSRTGLMLQRDAHRRRACSLTLQCGCGSSLLLLNTHTSKRHSSRLCQL